LASLNKIILVGRLTENPEIRTTVDGIPIVRFQLSVERRRIGAAPNGIDVIDVVAWRALAEYISANLSKGQIALVEGRIQNRSYEKNSGGRYYVTEVVANNCVPLDIKKDGKPKQNEKTQEKGKTTEEEIDYLGEDLPF